MALIDEIRAKYPNQYRTMTDKEVADQLYNSYYVNEMPKVAFYKQLGIDIPKSSVAEIVTRDVPLAGAQSVISAYEAAKGLTGLVPYTQGKIPKTIEKGEKALLGGTSSDLQQYLESLKSEGQQMVTQGAAEIPSTGNVLQDTVSQLQYAVENPQQIAQIVTQSLGPMYEGALIGRGITKAGTKFGKEISPITAAASGEGTVAAGAGLEGIRQQTEDKEVTGGQQTIAAFSGYMTNRLGRLGNRAAKYLGVDDMDVILTRGTIGATSAATQKAQSKLVAAFKSALSESVFEELPQSAQEQISQNVALGRPWDEGIAEQMAAGIIGGAGAGAGFGAYNQYKINKYLADKPPPAADTGAEPPSIDIEVPKTDTKKNALTRKQLIDSIEDEEVKKSLEELLITPKKGQPSGTQQTAAGISDAVSGGPGDGTTAGIKKPVGGGVAGATTDELADKTGETRSDVALENITADEVGKPFPTTGQAHRFRRANKLEDLYSVKELDDGTVALVPKIPVIKQKPAVTKTKEAEVAAVETKETKEPEVAAEEAEEDIADEEIGWEKFEETKPDGTITTGFRRKEVAAQQDAPVVKQAKTPKSTEVLKSEAELTEADKADLDQEEADEEAASQARINEANQGGFEDLPDYVKIGSKLASKSPVVQANESDPSASTELKRQEARRLAVKHAAFDQAIDEFDTASIEDFDAKLKELANEKLEELKKEMRDKGATEEEIDNRLGTKKFSINKPLEFMKGLTQSQRFSNYYKEFNKFLGKKNLPPTRIKSANTRNKFLKTLSEQERKLFNRAYSNYITTQVKTLKSGVASTEETETEEKALYRKLQKELELIKENKGSPAKLKQLKDQYAAIREKLQKVSETRKVVEKNTSALSDKVANLEQAIKDGENEIKSIKASKKIKDKTVQIKAIQTDINKNRVELKRAKSELETAQRTTTVLGAPGRYTNIAEEEKVKETVAKENNKKKKKEKAIEEGAPEEILEVLDEETEEEAKKIIAKDKEKAQKKAEEKAKKQPKITVVGKLNMIVSKSISQGKNIIETLDDLYDSKNKEKARSYQRTALLFSEVLSKVKQKGYALPKVEFGPVPNDRPGMYNPETNTITINDASEVEYGRVLVHETLHYLLDHIVEEYQKNPNSNLLSESQKVYLSALLESYNYAIPKLGEQFKNMEFKEFLAEAVEGQQFSIELGKLEPMPGRVLPFLRDLARSIAGMLGFRLEHRLPDVDKGGPAKAYILEAVLNDIESILTGEDYVAPNPLFRSGDVSFARKIDLSEDDEEAKKIDRTYEQIISGYGDLPQLETRSIIQKLGDRVAKGQDSIDDLATDLSNQRFVLERTQDNMDRSGAISYAEDTFNNFYDYISTAFGKAQWYIKQYVERPRRQYIIALSNFAAANNMSNAKAANVLKGYIVAFHAPERRKTKWLLNVPLDKLKAIKFRSSLFGNIEDTPANIRERIFETISADVLSKLSKEQRSDIAKALRNDLIRLVNTKGAITETGYSPAGYKKTNITEADYNVIEDHNFNDEQVLKTKYMSESNENRALIQQFFAAKKQIQDATIELNRMAGYWSNATDAIVEFYGWENYAPFKVRPGDKSAFKLNIEGTALGRTGKDYPGSRFEGSHAEVENPISQSLVEVAQAAARAGGKDVMRSISHAVQQGYLKGFVLDSKGKPRKKGEMNKPTYTFQDRYTGKVDEALLRKPNVLYSYNKDGSMDLIEITDPKQLEAIRRTYSINDKNHWTSVFWDVLNLGTSKLGQMHTRLNLGFPPYNFVRDVLTNVGIVSARENPLVGARIFMAAVLEIVGIKGIAKAAKFSFLFHNDKINEIKRLAEKDGFYKSLLEYGENGGNVSVVQGLSAASAMEQLANKLDKTLTLRSREEITKYFDIYGSMFEFGARIAVYRVMKRHFQNQMAKEQGVAPSQVEQAATIKAVAYTKNLANFEEGGKYAKEIGSWFMFFRAGSTGARQALKAVSPAWRKYEAVANTLPEATQKDPVQMAKFKKRFMQQKFMSRLVIAGMIGAGMYVWYMMKGLADDDEDKDQEGRNKIATDDSRRWTRNARIYLGYDVNTHKDRVGNIPWGFGVNSFMAFGAQIAAYNSGEGVELKDIAVNTLHIGMDSFVPIPATGIDPTENFAAFLADTIMPSIAKPFFEFAMNRNAMDQQIYRSTYNKYASSYTGSDVIPKYFKDTTEYMFNETGGAVNIDPNALYFYANNYFDGIAKFAESLHGGIQLLTGKKDFDIEKDAFVLDSFLSTTSNIDARRFDTLKKQIDLRAQKWETLKLSDPDQAYMFSTKTFPNLEAKIKILQYFENKALKPLREASNRISNDKFLDVREKQAYKHMNRLDQNHVKKGVFDTIKEVDDLGSAEINALLEMIAEDEAATDLRNSPDSNP